MLTSLGKELRILRINNGELLKDMAAKLSITPAYLSSIENGKRVPPRNIVQQLADIYMLDNVTIQKLSDAYYDTVEEIQINLRGLSDTSRSLGLVFARKFDNLSSSQVNSIMKILNGKGED